MSPHPEGPPIFVSIPDPIPWERRQDPDTGTFVAVCQRLNLAAWGSTEEELKDCQGKALTLLIGYLLERGVLESFMAERGVSVEAIPIMPVPQQLAKPKKAQRSRRKKRGRKAGRRQVYVRSPNHAYV